MTPAEEERHLVRITERLHTKFPHATTEAINSSVAHAYARFDGTPIRDYIPVLVERRAREQLQELATTRWTSASYRRYAQVLRLCGVQCHPRQRQP
ncbi:three-helix bundle dimerization domain-containing protein [Rhodococcus qingshengii]|uniref:three-helix bundle dimerization domain-containing protein n=1 Tax=Rhodococcus qingshengii TaxID=334542 RepID=UPI00352D8697